MCDRADRARRFVLIDHSIQGTGGHYLAYARRVLDAAAAAGLAPVLATNRRFTDTSLPYPTHPVYRHAIWFQTADAPVLGRLARVFQAALRSPLGRAAARLTRPLRRAAPGATFRAEIRRRLIQGFAADTETLLERLDLGADDLVFVPTLGAPEVAGLARLLARSESARRPSWHLLFRRNIYRRTDGMWDAVDEELCATFCHAFSDLEHRSGSRARIHYYTDTRELSRQFEHLLRTTIEIDRVFERLPIPVAPGFAGAPPPATPPFHLVYVGDARGEKGFEHLPAIVAATADLPLKFTIQCYLPAVGDEPRIHAARDALAGSARVHLIPHALDEDAYRQLIQAADIVLVPYTPHPLRRAQLRNLRRGDGRRATRRGAVRDVDAPAAQPGRLARAPPLADGGASRRRARVVHGVRQRRIPHPPPADAGGSGHRGVGTARGRDPRAGRVRADRTRRICSGDGARVRRRRDGMRE